MKPLGTKRVGLINRVTPRKRRMLRRRPWRNASFSHLRGGGLDKGGGRGYILAARRTSPGEDGGAGSLTTAHEDSTFAGIQVHWSSDQGHTVDALALAGEEGRSKLR